MRHKLTLKNYVTYFFNDNDQNFSDGTKNFTAYSLNYLKNIYFMQLFFPCTVSEIFLFIGFLFNKIKVAHCRDFLKET